MTVPDPRARGARPAASPDASADASAEAAAGVGASVSSGPAAASSGTPPVSPPGAGGGTARRDRVLGHLAMLLFAMAISVSFSLGGRAAPHIAPEALNAARFALALVALGAAAALGPGLRRAQLAAPWRYPLLGGMLAAYFILMFVALRITDPVSTGAVFTLTPVLAAIFGWLLLRQAAPPRMLLALALGGAGAIWVIFDADPSALLSLDLGRGEAIFFVGVTGHALYTPMVRKLNRGEPTLAFSFWTMLGAFAAILAVALATGSLGATDWVALPPVVWAAVVYLALGATALTFFLVQFAALRLPSGKVMAYGYLVPSFVVLWEGLFAGTWPGPALFAGIGVTVLAMAMLLKE